MKAALQIAEPNTLTGRAYATEKSARRVRVMLFTDSFIHGGTERQLVAVLRHIDRRRFDVRVGCLKRRGPFLREVESVGVPVEEFPIKSLYPGETREWSRKLEQMLRDEQIDVVHAFDFYTNVFALAAARRAGVPALLASRRELAGNRRLIHRIAIRYACHLADGVVANSRAAGSCLTALVGNAASKVLVVHNGIDLEAFRATRPAVDVRAEFGISHGVPLIGILAAMRPEKQIETFLRAASRVARELPGARFLLIGDGSERVRLEALVRKLGIGDRTIFAGDRHDVADLLAALDVFALSSFTESFPNAVLEAMAAARPVVATRVGGVPELVEDGTTGYLVPVCDDAAMATRIVELLRNPELRERMGRAGHTRVEREFTPQRMTRRFEDLYQRLLYRRDATSRVLQIGNYPPPVCGWSLHAQLVDQELSARGADSRVMDIGPGRRIAGRGCITVRNGLDYAAKLVGYRFRGFTFEVHMNGDSWKGYALVLAAVLLGRLTGKPAVLTLHAGPTQIYFPRTRGF